jgi:dihydroxyacetone kinase-like protein
MKMNLSISQTKQMILAAAVAVVESEEMLSEIDRVIGDNDHGTNMKLGFSTMMAVLNKKDDFLTVNELFKEAGMTLLKTMGGASGVIFGTLFIGGLTSLEPSAVMDENFFVALVDGALQSLLRRSKARLGDKTVMDAFIPAVETVKACGRQGKNLSEMIAASAEASREGMERTKDMLPVIGRSRPFKEKALGIPDAGAVSLSIIFGGFDSWFKKNISIQ